MAKRKRNFKAEYARRIAKAKASGKTRQQGRGHKAKEHVERAKRTKAKYGISPAQLTRLRSKARAKVLAVFEATARNPVNDATVRRGIAMLHPDDLRRLVDDLDPIDIISAAKIQDAYLDQLADYFPASIDDIEGVDFNPLWYHR